MILLLGGSGYVGQAYQRLFKQRNVDFLNLKRSEADYANLDTLRNLLAQHKPTFLINAAGYTGKPNVDACEIHKTECLFGNAILPGIIQTACEEKSVPWGHVSSGCIFTGTRLDSKGFREDDAPNFSFRTNNCSFYSGTKALGEEILTDASQLFIWRLRIPFNEVDGPRNYLSKLMRYDRLLEDSNSLSQLDEFVKATWECWEKKIPFGTYNVTNPGHVTTREVVDLILKSGLTNKNFSFFDSEEEFMQVAAKTPRSNCILDSSKLANAGVTMREVHDAIESSLREWKKES
jgi:dTDP-4-dehydrorhamnose reductase